MDEKELIDLLHAFKNGEKSAEEIMSSLRGMPFEDMGFAKVDHHRILRTGFPEVIYGEGKTDKQIRSIAKSIAQKKTNFLITRCREETARMLIQEFPDGNYYQESRIFAFESKAVERFGYLLVITAGTSDIPVAEEAAVTASIFGCNVDRIYDVGIAGVHRLLSYRSMIEAADVIVVAAGMEGALASVVAGISRAPVVALPTSVGYGANFRGLAALLGMLNSCSPGVSVVNIDNGFGAGCTAALICMKGHELAKRRVEDG